MWSWSPVISIRSYTIECKALISAQPKSSYSGLKLYPRATTTGKTLSRSGYFDVISFPALPVTASLCILLRDSFHCIYVPFGPALHTTPREFSNPSPKNQFNHVLDLKGRTRWKSPSIFIKIFAPKHKTIDKFPTWILFEEIKANFSCTASKIQKKKSP